MGNRNQDYAASIDFGTGNHVRDSSFNLHNSIQTGWDAIGEVFAKVLEPTRGFGRIHSEGIFELVSIKTGHCTICVDYIQGIGPIPKHIH